MSIQNDGRRNPPTQPFQYVGVVVTLVFSPLLLQIRRATATIIEPTGESDNPLRFTSGLVLALDIDATLEHVQDPQNTVKVQVRWSRQTALYQKHAEGSDGTAAAALVTSLGMFVSSGSLSRWSESCDPPQTRGL